MNQQALDDAQLLCPDLWSIHQILSPEELQDLLTMLEQEQDWQSVDLQENLCRQQASWKEHGVCDWLFAKLSNLDFSRFALSLRTVMVWKDTSGYIIGKHSDNDRVKGAMQIYLSADRDGIGTWFLEDIEIPFRQNTGYLMHNKSKLQHCTKTPVPGDYTRLSFYVLFDEIG